MNATVQSKHGFTIGQIVRTTQEWPPHIPLHNKVTVEKFDDWYITGTIHDYKGKYTATGLFLPGELEAIPARKLSPQAEQVLTMLQETGRITGVQAANVLKVRSLPRRILDLKEAGYRIVKVMKTDHTGQRYAEYSLSQP
ncbi:helix-turn-helix domain-containing protein [Mesorhizobium sp.]|uniref:helix-turn-helix domain-containing protein n=1 Tax=Mesorhizobium sp. TaxID=1871066 RepID=UPI000FE9E79F|nr:helix-turn-helix domain-containing protein [Mesorhizobium sp.]RWM84288.1 MAG: hypothetical protein EOR83_16835 [Mesorhizobium sp.]